MVDTQNNAHANAWFNLIQGQGAGSVIDSELFCDWPFWWSTAMTDTPNHAQV